LLPEIAKEERREQENEFKITGKGFAFAFISELLDRWSQNATTCTQAISWQKTGGLFPDQFQFPNDRTHKMFSSLFLFFYGCWIYIPLTVLDYQI
jgi:hypothetical protein